MGCAHSSVLPERVDIVTAPGALTRTARGPGQCAQPFQVQYNVEISSTKSDPTDVASGQADAATSRKSPAARRESSAHGGAQLAVEMGSELAASSQHAAAGGSLEPNGAAASLGPQGQTATTESPQFARGASSSSSPRSNTADTLECATATTLQSLNLGSQSKQSSSRNALPPVPLCSLSRAQRPLLLPQTPPQSPLQMSNPLQTPALLSVPPADSPFPVLKDLLARISSPPSPSGGRKLVLVVWDIENIRCPRGNGEWDRALTPAKVLGYIKAHFIHEPGRVEYRTVAAVTPKSLGVIRQKYPDFVDQVVPELTLMVASADEPKRNADVVLKKELYRFVSEHAHIARHKPGQLTIVLISGDEDFLEPVQVALNSGFSVELMHHDQPSWALRSQRGYAREPLLWSDFLQQRSGASHVKLPYNNSNHNNHTHKHPR